MEYNDPDPRDVVSDLTDPGTQLDGYSGEIKKKNVRLCLSNPLEEAGPVSFVLIERNRRVAGTEGS
jgi:hypothetical protein